MLSSTSASGGTRRGPGGRREVWFGGRWTPEGSLTDEQVASLRRQPEPVPPAEPVRTKPKGPTARQRAAWDAVREHGSQGAATKALGWSQGNLSSALGGYMRAMGIDGPRPGASPSGRSDRRGGPQPDHASDMHPEPEVAEVGTALKPGVQYKVAMPEPPIVVDSIRLAPPEAARLLLDGLFAFLPTPGSAWPYDERAEWLDLAKAIFRVVYP